MEEKLHINSLAVHSGTRKDDAFGAINEPIYMTSNYRIPTDGTPVDWSGIHSNIYQRNRNPNQMVLQDRLCALTGAEDGAVFASGVAALAAVFTTTLNSGDHAIVSEVCYSATNLLFRKYLPEKYGVEVTLLDTTDTEAVRGLATAPLRMKQHCSVAMAVAEFLELCPATRFVWYPGLKSHPQHALAEKLMHGQYSGMIAFDLKGDEKQHEAFLDALHLVTHAVSLGDIESLIVYYDRHSDKLPHYPAVYQEGFFRFSVGLEDAEDIIADLQQAMQAAGML